MRKQNFDDIEERYGDDEDEPTFQRIKKQTDKAQTLKGDRRQQQKEWGKTIAKFQKQRSKRGKP